MTFASTTSNRLPALAAALLLTAAIPAGPSMAKEKVKGPKPAPTTQTSVDYTVSIPAIQTDASNMSDTVLKDVLGGNIAGHADELARLTAKAITVPEILVTITSTDGEEQHTATFTLNDLTLTDVVDGVAGGLSIGETSLDAEDVSAEFGTFSADEVNIGAMLGIYGLVPSAGSEFETIYTNLSASGGTLTSDDVSCEIGATQGAEFKARPLKTSFAEMMAIGMEMEKSPEEPDPALLGRFLRMYADVLTAFETSEVSFDGISCKGQDSNGKPMAFDVDGVSMGAMSPGVYPSISFDGISIDMDDEGSMSLDNFTSKPMDLSGAISTLESAPELVDQAWLDAHARALIPEMEGFSFSGFDIDIPDPEAASERIKATVGKFDLSLATYRNGIPTDADLSVANIQAAIPEDTQDETLAQLRALGITDIDAGFRFAAAWNEATNSIDIKEASVSGVDLASIVLAGTISNATQDLFSLDTDAAAEAAMAVGVKALDLTVTDQGLSDIILSVVAAEQNADPATLRPVFAGLAQGTIISLMAGAADAAKLGDAVNRFVSGKAKTLMVGIAAKDEAGLSFADLNAAEEDPSQLLDKVNVSAEAN